MSFLAPWMLIALPLASIPIIVHLINQRRYQTTQWAAMTFLLTANKMNRGFARIRQWLILAFRTLVIAALIVAVGRPLVSGSLGSIFGRGASTAIVLVDRSPSMQTRLDSQSATRLESGLGQIVETLETLNTSRIVLIESNLGEPLEIESARSMLELPEVTASDKTADIAGMLSAALDYITTNEIGQSDIWICSDLQAADWNADDGRWNSIREAFSEMGQRNRFRLLAFSEPSDKNRKVRVTRSVVETIDANAYADISLEIQVDQQDSELTESTRETIPVTFDVGGSRSSVEVNLEGGTGKLTGHRIPLPAGQSRGYGSVSIPADANFADNEFQLTFDVRPTQRCVIVTSDDAVGRVMQLATEIPARLQLENATQIITPDQSGSIAWDELALLVWHAPFPESDSEQSGAASAIEAMVKRGGRVLFLPPAVPGGNEFFGCRWEQWQQPPEPIAVTTWRSDTDVLSATQSGASLPVGKLKINRYVTLQGETIPLAKLDGGQALLSRATSTSGGVYFCTTTTRPEDSSLATDGVVLYVAMQRLLADGSVSLGSIQNLRAGESDDSEAAKWQRLSGRKDALSSDNAFIAGVYAIPESDRWVSVNRSLQEDDPKPVPDDKVDRLFAGLALDRISPGEGQSGSLVEEAWRAFLIIMLAAMVGEALLCLPRIQTTTGVRSPARGIDNIQPQTKTA